MSGADSNSRRTFHRFVTRPDIDAPVWITRYYQNVSVLAPGYWFVAFYYGVDQRVPGANWVGPHIYDSSGELVWGGGTAFKHWNVFDFGVIEGQQKLSLLSKHDKMAYILDKDYQVSQMVPLVEEDDQEADMHSFNVVSNGDRAMIITNRPWNTTTNAAEQVGYGGPCFAKYQGFRELDLATSKSIFEWNARDWIGLDESTYQDFDGTIETMCERGWDIL